MFIFIMEINNVIWERVTNWLIIFSEKNLKTLAAHVSYDMLLVISAKLVVILAEGNDKIVDLKRQILDLLRDQWMTNWFIVHVGKNVPCGLINEVLYTQFSLSHGGKTPQFHIIFLWTIFVLYMKQKKKKDTHDPIIWPQGKLYIQVKKREKQLS